jgi:hypothetical protein
MLSLVLEFVVLVERLQEVRLLGILPLELTTGMGGSVALRWRGGIVHGLSFVVLVLLQAERVGSLVVVTVVVFVEVALVGKMVWFVLTPLSSKWLGTGFTLLELTSVLSRLLALALGFELQVDGPENVWLISGVVLRPHTPVVTWRYITFGDGGQGRVNCEEMIKVSKFVTFKCVALVKPLGSFCSLPYLMCVR